MPVYHARSIAVHLGSMPLVETTTNNVVLKKGEVAKRQSETAEKKLLRSGYLNEKHVSFPGDSGGFELNWLGNAPFMQVQVNPGFTQSFRPYPSAQESKTDENIPRALILHVELSDKSFMSGFNGKTHLKIEVLFNGQLSNCSLIHTNDIRSGAKSLHQTFAGYRVDFLAERPWVLLPPFMNADGGIRRFRKTVTPKERWDEICTAILKEANERGTDKHGEPSQSAAFLQALAGMEMPECVKAMQKPGGRRFGVVDVVITAGSGNKIVTGTNYLKRPQRLEDSNYAVRADVQSDEDVVVIETDCAQDTADKVLNEASPEHIQNLTDARELYGFDNRPCKRQTLSSADRLSQHSATQKTFQSPFLSDQIPVLPPPTQHSFGNSPSSHWGIASPRCPSPEHRSDGRKHPLPTNSRRGSYSTTRKINNHHGTESDASLPFQGYHSPPPETRLHEPSLPLPETTVSYGSFGGPPFASSPSVSSPVLQVFSYHTAPPSQHFSSDQVDALNSTTHLGRSAAFVPPTASILPAPSNWSIPPLPLDPSYHHHLPKQSQRGSHSYPPTYMPYVRPNGLPSTLSETPPLCGNSGPAHFRTPVLSGPPLPRPCEILPPTAMFSVPSKPRRCSSPEKTAATNNPAPRASVLVSRLTIKGQHGKLIVDHAWIPAQYVLMNTLNDGREFTGDRTKIERGKIHEKSSSQKNSFQEVSRAVLLSEKPQIETTARYTDKEGGDSVVGPAIEVPLPYLKRHQGPTNEVIPHSFKIDVPDKIAPFVPAHMLAAATSMQVTAPVPKPRTASHTQSTVLQRRTFSRSSLPSIQGPKAATYLFDDPEEVLREASRMRRSRSPTKPAAMLPVLPITPTTRIDPMIDQEAHGDSSPLSSAPSSPLPDRRLDVVPSADTAPNRIPQLDGSPQHKPAATSPRRLQTPSPAKLSFTAPKLQRPVPAVPVPAVPAPSASPNSKKRKTSRQSPTRPPRSPGRLKTVSNPALNQDCVIAFAESVNKTEERGVLRQVKGERRGEFREEYVALAVRFFIAGD